MSGEVRVPEVGESITDGLLAAWHKQDGDHVRIDDDLFDLETDKITMTIKSEFAGQLKILTRKDTRVEIGQLVAMVQPGAQISAPPPVIPAPEPRLQVPAPERTDDLPPVTPPAGWTQVRSKAVASQQPGWLTPSVRRLIAETQIDPDAIPASGPGGRITKEDVQRFLQEKERPVSVPEQAAQGVEPAVAPGELLRAEPDNAVAAAPRAPSLPSAPLIAPFPPRQTRQKMSTLRQRIAERLVLSQQTAAILTTFNEADMTNVLAWRQRHNAAFQTKHGIKLGLIPFFVKAAVDALKTVPELNSRIEGDEIVTNHFYDIGIAVSTDHGLIVPVLRDADKLRFIQIEQMIQDFAHRARERRLALTEITGGSFTISNGGVFGSLLSTPILNPPQSGILGLHAIKRRPVAVGDAIVVRPMMYLALSYDHRIIDGRESVTFLRRIVECIENPERIMLEI